ncbi:MAG: hypothetical protein PVI30_20995 [Myxococcales bacterium]|jgi:hypothetical protein
MTLEPSNGALLRDFSPFVVATADNLKHFDREPFGIPLAAVYDPMRLQSAPVLERLCALDQLAFGPEGMPMPRFIFFDGGELTGAVCGLAAPAAQLDPQLHELLSVPPRYAGLVPISMYIAIPGAGPGRWIGHNLASVAARYPSEEVRGLGSLTKALALRVIGAREQIGAAQWDSPAVHVHARLGPLEVISAWTPAHTKPWTFTYRAVVTDASLRHLARDPGGEVHFPRPTEWLTSDDHGAMRALQERIEAGARVRFAGRPVLTDRDVQRIPLSVTGP